MSNNCKKPAIRFQGFTDDLPAGRQVGNSWYTYVLECENGSYYKGKTNDLERRIHEHLSGKGAKHTRLYGPTKLVYVKEFYTEEEAVVHEKFLKSGCGREYLKTVLQKEGNKNV